MGPTIVLVSKPLGPPWNNGSGKLVSELVDGFARLESRQTVRFRVFGKPGYKVIGENVEVIALGGSERGWNKATISHLLRLRDSDVHHFFFAPHLAAVVAARFVSAAVGARTVQTLCSQPRSFRDARWLCFGKKVVVLSSWTKERLVEAGVQHSRIEVIYPPLLPLDKPERSRLEAVRSKLSMPPHARYIVFPGDAEPGGGLETLVDAIPLVARQHKDLVFVIACRQKTPKAAQKLEKSRRIIERHGLVDSVRFVGEVDDFHAVLAASDLCVLPASSLYAKVDFPYALLEAMSLETPVLVAHGTPLEELVSVCGGSTVPRRAPSVLASAIGELIVDRRRLVERGKENGAIVRKICDPLRVAQQYLSLILEIAQTTGDH